MVVTNGIYFSSARNEVFAKTSETESLPDDVSWIQVSNDTSLGLMAIRKLVVDRGLVTEGGTIYWHGLKTKARDDPEWLLHMSGESPLAA